MGDAPKRPKPWRRLRTGATHDFTILKIREDTVADPRNGAEHPRVIIDAPDWVNVIAVTPDDQVILIRQFRFGVWENCLEIPGGMVDPGEDPRTAAIRELEEETGYRPREVRSLGSVHPNPAIQTNRCHTFLALGCERAHAGEQDHGEDITVELHPRATLHALVASGEISHSLVVAAFFLEALKR